MSSHERVRDVGNERATDIMRTRLAGLINDARNVRAALEAARIAIEQSRQAMDKASDAVHRIDMSLTDLTTEIETLMARSRDGSQARWN